MRRLRRGYATAESVRACVEEGGSELQSAVSRAERLAGARKRSAALADHLANEIASKQASNEQ